MRVLANDKYRNMPHSLNRFYYNVNIHLNKMKITVTHNGYLLPAFAAPLLFSLALVDGTEPHFFIACPDWGEAAPRWAAARAGVGEDWRSLADDLLGAALETSGVWRDVRGAESPPAADRGADILMFGFDGRRLLDFAGSKK